MRIAQFIMQSPWGDVCPDNINKGMGGRETALVQLGMAWERLGHEVINFVPMTETKRYGDAIFCDKGWAQGYLENFPIDVCVSWEEPRLFANDLIQKNVPLKIVEMQVAHLQTFDPDTQTEMDQFVDKYAVLSKWAGDFLMEQDKVIKDDKIVVFPNGVDLGRYPVPSYGHPGGGPYKFFYSSSPDRGLHHLLRMWPDILKRWPGSELNVAYGIESWAHTTKWMHRQQSEVALEVLEKINQPGVNYRGKMGQDELAHMQVECDLLLYPCDTFAPTETGCITIVEAGAACTPVVTTDCDCLGTEFETSSLISELPLNYDHYVDLIAEVLENPTLYVKLQKKGRALAESRNWDNIAKEWESFFQKSLN